MSTGVGACGEGLACLMNACALASATDASAAGARADAGAKPAGEAGADAALGGHPVWSTLAVGGDHTCALRAGQVKCWGASDDGQLGIGVSSGPQTCFYGNSCSTVPIAVTGLTASVDSIAAGQYGTCALLAGGTVACWGMNSFGQLGDETTTGPELCTGLPCSTTPVVVPGVSGATAVATNGGEACAILSSGAVECWGSAANGELGSAAFSNGDAGASLAPTPVSGLTQVTAVALGAVGYGCALLVDGTVQCWGDNEYGELGNGSIADSPTPVPVSGVTGAVAVATGWEHACALMTDGTVACWGDNLYGELGIGTSSGPETCGEYACATTPVKVPGLSGATAVAAGENETCAILSDETVRCWGYNHDGELGDGTTVYSSTPMVVSGLSGATAIAMGGMTSCALLSSGGVACWGENDSGQLGGAIADTPSCGGCSETPVSISGL
jgi:alpha-tubulin suppressor-like RCC1 family protein